MVPFNVKAFGLIELESLINQKVILHASFVPPVQPVSWSSVVTTTQGNAHSLPIVNDGLFTEPRINGGKKFIVEYSGGIHPLSVSTQSVLVEGCSSSGPIVVAPNQMSLQIEQLNILAIQFNPPLPDVSQIRITVQNLRDFANRVIPTTTRSLHLVKGDVNGDRVTDASDYSYIFGFSLQCSVVPALCNPIALSNLTLLRNDVNASFTFNGIDLSLVNSIVQDGSAVGFGHDARDLNCF